MWSRFVNVTPALQNGFTENKGAFKPRLHLSIY